MIYYYFNERTGLSQGCDYMSTRNEQKTEKHANYQVFQEISSNLNSFNQEVVARGVGFEPTRPLLTTGLACL